MQKFKLKMLISGGQTGVDRAALDFARKAGIRFGGWCPKGRRAEDGVIPDCYPMTEASSELYQQRTRLNVRDSDATLIIADESEKSRGTALTVKYALKYGRPCLVINHKKPDLRKLQRWLQRYQPAILNVAGPRLSESFDITEKVHHILSSCLEPEDTTQICWPPRRPHTRKLFLY